MSHDIESYTIVKVSVWNSYSEDSTITLFESLDDFIGCVYHDNTCHPIVSTHWAELNAEVCQLHKLMAHQLYQNEHGPKQELIPLSKDGEFTMNGITVKVEIDIDYHEVYRRVS